MRNKGYTLVKVEDDVQAVPKTPPAGNVEPTRK
jgi:hypothetical protein